MTLNERLVRLQQADNVTLRQHATALRAQPTMALATSQELKNCVARIAPADIQGLKALLAVMKQVDEIIGRQTRIQLQLLVTGSDKGVTVPRATGG